MRLGIHMPQKGGFKANVERAAGLGCQSIQIFPGNPTGWQMGALEPAEIESRAVLLEKKDLRPLVVHSAYLINLATSNEEFLAKSRQLLNETMQRAAAYRSPYVVLHTGNHVGQGPAKGLEQLISVIEAELPGWPKSVQLLLENTAGSGTALGASFEELAEILDHFPRKALGICIDTAHGWAAGYDLGSRRGVEKTLARLDSTVGLERLRVIHINDTKAELGARLDRHAHIGEGRIGKEGFAAFLNYGWPDEMPVILETPEIGSDRDRVNLQRLQELTA